MNMKMNVVDKTSLFGVIFLVFILLIRLYSNHSFNSSFNELHLQNIESAKKDFVDAGFSSTQASTIAHKMNDEVFLLKAMVSSQNTMQYNLTFFCCLIVLMLSLSAIKKMIEEASKN